jgi:hypothetical protein
MGRRLPDLSTKLLPYLNPVRDVEPHELLIAYLDASDSRHAFTGRAFDTYGSGASDPNVLSGSDIIAVAMLSIEIRAKSKSGITPDAALRLEERSGEITALLERIDPTLEMHQLHEKEFMLALGGEESPGRLLHGLLLDILRDKRGNKWVATHKLLARKRPGLFPIRDQVVSDAVGLGSRSAWWRPWWEALTGEFGAEIVGRADEVRRRAGADHLSVLRTLDILIWTREQGRKDLPTDLRKRLGK